MPQKKLDELRDAVVGALSIIASTQDDSKIRPRIRALATALSSGKTNLAELTEAVILAKSHPPKQTR